MNAVATRKQTVQKSGNIADQSAGSVGTSAAGLPKHSSHPDLKALQRELERDPKHEAPHIKLIKKTRKQFAAVKKGFFAALVALLVESHNSVFTIVIITIEFLQNLAFCFANVDWGPHGHWFGVAVIMFQVEEAVVKYTAPEAIFVLVAISVILIIVMLSLAFYVLQSFMNSDFNKGVWPLRMLRTLVSFLASIFFLPIVYTLFGIFSCHDKDHYEVDTCSNNRIYIGLRILAGICLPLFFGFTMLMSMTYFNPNPKATSIDARPTARLELLELSTKVLLAVFFVFAESSPILRECVTFFCSASTAVFMWIYIPYYKKEINLYRFCLICQVIWGSIMAIIVASVGNGRSDEEKNYIFYAYLAGIVPGVLISYFAFNARQNHATSYEIACKNFKVTDAAAFNTWDVEEAEPDGGNEKRFWNHTQVEIATRFLITEKDPKAIEIADKIFLFGTKKFPNSSALMVHYAIFFLVHKEDSSVATSYLKKAEKLSMLVDTEFTIYQQQQEIKSGGATIGNKKLDAVDRVEFKQLMKEAKLSYKEARASIASFWLAIMTSNEQEGVDTSILMQHVSQMERSDAAATESFTRLMIRYPLSVKVLSSYASFLDDIHNNHEESELIRRRIKRICDAGLSDDVSYAATPLSIRPQGGGVAASAVISGQGSSAHMSKKSKRAFKEYRKQVYHYSKGNSALLTWMVRGIQVFYIVVAFAQLYATQLASVKIKNGISYLNSANACRNSHVSIHSGFRNIQKAIKINNMTQVEEITGSVAAAISSLSLTSSDLYRDTNRIYEVNRIWSEASVPMKFSNGPGTYNASIFNMTLMDATSVYVRRSTAAIQNIVNYDLSDINRLSLFDLDSRFSLDNGLTSLMDAYTQLERVIATDVRLDVAAVEYWHIGIIASSLLLTVVIAIFLFAPVISKAKTERETSLKAFLQIPKEVTQSLYSKYFDPESASRESLNEDNTDDEKEAPGQAMSIFDSLKNQTGYKKMITISRTGLALIGIFLALSFAVDFYLLFETSSIPCALADTFDIPSRASRIVYVTLDVADWGTSTFNYNEYPYGVSNLLKSDLNEILESQVALLYGSTIDPHFTFKLDPSIIYSIAPLSRVYDGVSRFFDSGTILANTVPISASNSDLLRVQNSLGIITEGYTDFLQSYLKEGNASIGLLSDLSYGIMAIMVAVVIATYFMYWKRILNYLIKTENERTLKLLLMIPVEIVADIDSLRELLHLKRTTISGPGNTNTPQLHTNNSFSGKSNVRNSFAMNPAFSKYAQSFEDDESGGEYDPCAQFDPPPVPGTSLTVPSSNVNAYLARESRRRASIGLVDVSGSLAPALQIKSERPSVMEYGGQRSSKPDVPVEDTVPPMQILGAADYKRRQSGGSAAKEALQGRKSVTKNFPADA
ncbi:hypothetical protein BJ741DRAFT_287174 [Chytriomyces cf. hyalinus JEL632]|nr:hypothetical protein BJ741DRAFT_287174 [Chytriomyces cf. hyalinus JEL632]